MGIILLEQCTALVDEGRKVMERREVLFKHLETQAHVLTARHPNGDIPGKVRDAKRSGRRLDCGFSCHTNL